MSTEMKAPTADEIKEAMPEQFRLLPVRGAARVDREARVIYGVSLAQEGEALGHNMLLDRMTLEQIANKANAKRSGLKSRYTHPGLSNDGFGKLLGRIKDVEVGRDKAIGDLYLADSASRSPHGDLADYVMSLAEEDPEAFGLSIVFKGKSVWVLDDGSELPGVGERPERAVNKKPVARIKELLACDAVDEPAANRDGLFSRFSSSRFLWGTNELCENVFGWIDAKLAEQNMSPERAYQFALSYFEARGVELGVIVDEEQQMFEEDIKDGAAPGGDSEPTPEVAGNQGYEWLAVIREQAISVALTNSGLSVGGQEAVVAGLNGDVSPARLNELIALQRKAESELVKVNPVRGIEPITEGEMSTVRDELEGAMAWVLGAGGPLPKPHLRSIREIYLAVTGDIDFHGVFNPDYVKFAAANSTTMAGLAVDALNKSIGMHYDNQQTYRWYEMIADVLPHDGSTHDIELLLVDGISNLPTVPEGAAYTESTVGDSKETATFSKKGSYVGITLEMIRKSDIARIQAIPRELVKSSVRTRSAAVSNYFTQASGVGPTLNQDSKALFHADHGNLATAAFSTSEWGNARKRIWEQTLPGISSALGLWPTFVLVPIDIYDSALIAFGYGSGDVGKPSSAGTAQEVNPYAGSRPGDPRPIPVAVPEWTDTNDWAYIVDPRLHPVICMAYANAPQGNTHPLPEVFQVTSETSGLMFTNDTMPVKIRDWWATGVATYIGVGKNNVA